MPESRSPEFGSRLIIFARYPDIGKVNTRLIPDLGAEAATKIYRELAEFTLKQARALRLRRKVDIEVWFTGGTKAEMQAWLGEDVNYQTQVGANLGERLIFALKTAVNADLVELTSANAVIIIGTDCPELVVEILDRGLAQLHDHDLVLGGATDGGYYLIGLQKFVPELFTDIPWSTDAVFRATLGIAKKMEMREFLLPKLSDVDIAADVEIWAKIKAQANFVADFTTDLGEDFAASNPKISIIIPTLNEAANLPRTLEAIADAENIEIIIVDGGSTDETKKIAAANQIGVMPSIPGRARQMNLGASVATGEMFLFLHADTLLPPKFDRVIREILGQKISGQKIIAGAFALKIDAQNWKLRLIEWGVNLRSRALQMPYGDQGIFIKAEQFRRLGGFAQLPIMEDFDLIWRLKTQGKIAISNLAVTTSARRWQKIGVFKTTLINQVMIIGYLAGISPAKLAQFYQKWKN